MDPFLGKRFWKSIWETILYFLMVQVFFYLYNYLIEFLHNVSLDNKLMSAAFYLIQDGGVSFSSLTSPNVRLAPKTFWLLVSTILRRWCKISSSYLIPVSNYWTWTKTTPQNKPFFWSNPYKIGVMITSLTQMFEVPNFGHLLTFTL